MERADKSPVSTSPSGVLVVDKPVGPSSSQVVAIVRRRAGGARTGHAATLDPLATGVLVLGLGRATKILPRLLGADKAYETRIDLSAFTETDDHESDPSPVHVARPPSAGEVRDAGPVGSHFLFDVVAVLRFYRDPGCGDQTQVVAQDAIDTGEATLRVAALEPHFEGGERGLGFALAHQGVRE